MNERIQELVGQAKFMAEETINKQISKNAELDAFAEKFAELIVQECLDVALAQKKWVEDQKVFNLDDQDWNQARIQQSQHIVDKIKQHFGVEE